VNLCAVLPDGKIQWHATVLDFVVPHLHSQRIQTVQGVKLALKFTWNNCWNYANRDDQVICTNM